MKGSDGRLYTYTVWSLSVFMVAASGALLIVMLANVIGPFRFAALDPMEARDAVGFWLPVDGPRPFPPEIARRTEAWRRFVERDDVVIESSRLRDLLNAGVGAVILPDARRLSDGEADALERYMHDGGGIVVSGSVGVRDERDAWRGYDLMRTLLRATGIVPLPREQSQVLAAHRRGPISARLGPGGRFRVLAEPGVPALEGRDGELLWAAADDADGDHAVAARRVRLGRGRLAWVGPGPEVVFAAEEDDRRALDTTLANALAWVRRRPVLELQPWPDGARFALAVTKHVDAEHAPATDAARDALFDGWMAALDAAVDSGEHLLVDIPAISADDAWAEATRVHLIERGRSRGAWLASREEAADWMAMRSGARVSVSTVGPRRMLVDVTNRWTEDLEGVGLHLWINRPAASIEVSAVNLGQALPRVEFDRATESARLALPPLRSGATLGFTIDLDDPGYDGSADLRSD